MKDLSILILKGIAYVLRLLFVALIGLGHPDLVAGIISQVETPFAIRIGGVIITYAILFAISWFYAKFFGEPDEKQEQKKDADEKNHRDKIGAFVLAFVIGLAFLIPAAFMVRQELQLRHQLLQEGVSAVATVQRCEENKSSRDSSCYMSYDYQVPLANTTKLYTVTEQISCARACQIGSSVDISYLPQTPSEAGIEGNTYSLKDSVFWLTIFFNVLCLLLSQLPWATLQKKLKPHMR